MGYFLGIDIGTFESKGMLTDEDGACVATHVVGHRMQSPCPGFAEHDALKDWWGDFCAISKALLDKSGVGPGQILGVGASAIGPCCLPVDKDCNPLRPAILYGVDVRAGKQIAALNQKLGEDRILAKYGNPITSQSIGPKILWIRENEPEIYKSADKFITASTYLTAKLTGKYRIDRYTAAYFTPMYNLEANDWDYDNLAGFCRPEQLAECRWADEVVGGVAARAAAETGLREGTPVIVGTADAAADAVGVGVFNPGDMLLMFGSSVYIIHIVPKLTTDRRYWSGPYLFRDTYMVASGMSTAGTLTRWFRDQLAPDMVLREKEGEGNAYDLLLAATGRVPPGSEGLIVLPYFSGERTPINDPAARGVVFGLMLHHTRAHIYQACLEGVAYGIAQHFRGYAEIGMRTDKVVAVGGGVRSAKWMQIVADACGRELLLGGAYGAPYGDALMAALGVGRYASVDDIARRVTFTGGVRPNPANAEAYARGLEVYTRLYEQTRDLMHLL
ncbi:MAG: carbohydrate kinase [Planctomycetota bacterium]|jgi:xylulokinase|nr:carbohydrate kinase [Planctomycetota bacterium]